jgi:hypothetical protein
MSIPWLSNEPLKKTPLCLKSQGYAPFESPPGGQPPGPEFGQKYVQIARIFGRWAPKVPLRISQGRAVKRGQGGDASLRGLGRSPTKRKNAKVQQKSRRTLAKEKGPRGSSALVGLSKKSRGRRILAGVQRAEPSG